MDKDSDTSKLVQEDGYSKIYIIGGYSVISSDFEAKLKSDDRVIIRLAGNNRYETNEATLKESGYKRVGLASGQEYADALSAAKFLNENKMGLLLANKKMAEEFNSYKQPEIKDEEKADGTTTESVTEAAATNKTADAIPWIIRQTRM